MPRNPAPAVIAALLLVIAVLLLSSCEAPQCPAGQVAESDEDGWECEPDSDGNGVDDEQDALAKMSFWERLLAED